MSHQFAVAPTGTDLAAMARMFEGPSDWLVVTEHGRPTAVVTAEHVHRALAELESDTVEQTFALAAEQGQRCVTVPATATLREALDAMDRDEVDVAVITGSSKRNADTAFGILTRAQIEAGVRYGR